MTVVIIYTERLWGCLLIGASSDPREDPTRGPNDGTPARRRRRGRRALLVLLVLLVTLLALVHAPFVRRLAERAIVAKALSAIDTDLVVDHLDYNLFTLRVSVRNVSLTARGRPSSEAFFRADRVNVRLHPSVLRGHVRLAAVEIVRPSFAARRGADGRFNLPRGKSGSGRAPTIEIDRLVVDRLDAAFLDSQSVSIVLRQASIDAQGAGARIQGRLASAHSGSFRVPPGDELGLVVDAQLRYGQGQLSVHPLTLRLEGTTVTADGRLAFDRSPAQLDLSFRAEGGLDDAARLWPALAPARGRLSAIGRLTGPVSRPALVFDATTTNALMRGLALDGASVHGRLDGSAVALDPVVVEVAGGRITGSFATSRSAASDLESPDVESGFGGIRQFQLKGRWERVDLAALLAALGVRASPKIPAASLTGHGAAEWNTRGLASLSADASTGLVARPPVRGEAATGRFRLHVEGPRWSLDVAQSVGGASRIGGAIDGRLARGRFSETTIGGRLQVGARIEELSPWATLVRALPPLFERTHGTANAEVVVAGTLGTPRATVSLSVADLRVDRLGTGTLESVVHVGATRATVDRLALTLGHNNLEATGSVPFDRTPVDARFSGTLDDLAAFFPTSTAHWLPSGPIGIAGKIAGRIDALSVEGNVTAPELSINGFRAGPVDGVVSLNAGRVSGTVALPTLAATLMASMDLAAPRRYEVRGALAGTDLSRLADLAGRLGVPALALTGTTRAEWRLAGAEGAGPARTEEAASALTADVQLHSLDGAFEGLSVRLQRPARFALSSSSIAVDDLSAVLGGATLEARGALGPTGGGSIRATVQGPIDGWVPWLRRASGLNDLRATGPLQAEVAVSGSTRQPDPSGRVSLQGVTVAAPSFGEVPGISADLALENGTIQLAGHAVWAGAPVQASGSMPLRMLSRWLPAALAGSEARRNAAGGRLRLEASVASVSLDALAPWLSSEARGRLDGRVGATVDIEASELALASLRGVASLSTADLSVNGIALRAVEPARVRFESGRLLLEPASFQTRGETLTVGGTLDINAPQPTFDVSVKGGLDLGIARAFVPMAVGGTAAIDVRVAGNASDPKLTGAVRLADTAIGISNPRIAVSGVNGTVSLQDDRVTVDLTGSANGGSLTLGGTLALGAGRPAGSLRLQGKDNAVEWPEGLRSSLDLDVTYRIDAGGGLLSGRITAEPGAYRRAAVPATGTRGSPSASSSPRSFVDATRLDLAIATRSPGLVDNSFAEIEVDADLTITGTVDRPAVGGRLSAREGGKLSLRGNHFVIDRGLLLFDPKPGVRPALDLTARGRRSGYNIAMALSGSFDNLRVDLSSDPPLAQTDLMSLIATGSVSNSMSGSGPGGNASQDALVAGISSDILGFAGSSIGLDSVRVGQLDLDLMGQDVDPETRLTIGKSIGSRVDVLLSQNLREAGLTWVITVRPTGKFEVSYVSRDSESASLELRHEFVFGGAAQPPTRPPAPARRKSPFTVGAMTVSGAGASQDLLKHASLQIGDRFDFFQWQRDRERMEEALRESGYLEGTVAARRSVKEESPGLVALDFAVTPGPRTTLKTAGFALPEQVLAGMRAAWSISVDDTRLLADLQERARVGMVDEGYPAATASVALAADRPEEKTLVVTIAPGAHASNRRLAFEGNRAFTAEILQREIERRGLERDLWRNPAVVGPALAEFYRARGFFGVRVTPGQLVVRDDTAQLPVTIAEGPLYRVASVVVVGAKGVDQAPVREWAGIHAGDVFDPNVLQAAGQRIQKGLERQGYLEARARLTPRADEDRGRVEIVADVTPGVRSVIASVEVTGRDTTREVIVARAMRLPPGTPAAPAAVDAAQRRLYETDAFRSVKIDLQPAIVPPDPGQPSDPEAAAQGSRVATNDRPMKATVTLEEAPLYRLRYGVQFGSELDEVSGEWTNNPGFAVELRRRNVFGTGFGAAVGLRADMHKQSVRGAINIPSSVFWPAISTLFVTRSRTVTETDGRVTENELQVTYQDRWRLRRGIEWTYGYTLTGSDRHEEGPVTLTEDGDLTVNGHRAAVYTALARDTRDTAFNATRGTFHSISIEHGGSGLGSDVGYMRYLFQGSYYFKAGPLVLAAATRFGALTHLTGDNQLTYDIRFRTGGDREVRGYAEQSLHPPEVAGEPIGGQALLLLNGEARFPIWGWLKGATFVDAGNAFTEVHAVSFGGLKVGMGLGLRLDTPYALFRVDFGMPVPREPNGPFGRWHFSVGQAF